MNSLDFKKLTVEFKRVDAAKEEMELRIHEREEELTRMREAVKVQSLKLEELKVKMSESVV
jgi:hypothetical protein